MNGATRSAAAAPKAAPPRFSHRQRSERARPEWPDADPGVLTRVSARFAVRSARLLGGPILDWRAGGPNAAQPELKPSALSMYGWIPVIARKGFSGGAPSLHSSPQSQPRIPGFGRILVGFPSGRIAAPPNDRLARLLTLTVSLNLGTICRCNSRFWTKFERRDVRHRVRNPGNRPVAQDLWPRPVTQTQRESPRPLGGWLYPFC